MAIEEAVETYQFFAAGVAILNRPRVLGWSRLRDRVLARVEAGG
jgi:hypothetical protein